VEVGGGGGEGGDFEFIQWWLKKQEQQQQWWLIDLIYYKFTNLISSLTITLHCLVTIGPLHDAVTWYKITHAGEQGLPWDFQNKGRSRWAGTSCIVLEVPLCSLHISMCDFVPCDRIVQRAYCMSVALIGIWAQKN